MNKELQAKLRQHPICAKLTGIYVGDGWFDLIEECTFKIEQYCIEQNIPFPEAVQIKDKFGSLRYYLDYQSHDHNNDDHNQVIAKIILEAEGKSGRTCKVCGATMSEEDYKKNTSMSPICITCSNSHEPIYKSM